MLNYRAVVDQAVTDRATHVLFTRNLRVCWSPPRALDPAAPIQLHGRGDALFISSPIERLQQAMRAGVGDGPARTARAGVVHEGPEWLTVVKPLAQTQGQPLALVSMVDIAERIATAVRLAESTYGLTRAEAALCRSLLEARTLQEHAEARGVLISTVRSHVKSLLHKTGSPRQTTLVATLSRLLIAGS